MRAVIPLTVLFEYINLTHAVPAIYVVVIPRYEYDIVVITRVQGEAEYECQ